MTATRGLAAALFWSMLAAAAGHARDSGSHAVARQAGKPPATTLPVAAAPAPEIGSGAAFGAVTLLLGGLVVLRGRWRA